MERKAPGSIEERRPAVRMPVDLQATYGDVGGASRHAGRVTEISASGLRLRTSSTLSVGMSVEIAFDLHDPARRSRTTVNVRAQVVRVVCESPPLLEYALRVLDDQALKASLRQAVLKINLSAHAGVFRY
jgi:hypothetical protein